MDIIERLYRIEVLQDCSVGLENIKNVRLQIPVDALEDNYDIPGVFLDRFITVDLGPMLARIRVVANALVEQEVYPD
jgi:hypothetical protein